MNSSVKYMSDRLTVRFRLTNILINHKCHPQEFLTFENLLWNIYGPPMIRLEPCRYSSTGLYWKRNIDGVWARVRNEFYFKDQRTAMIAKLHMPADFEITKKLI